MEAQARSSTFLRVVAFVALALALAEFAIGVHFQRRLIAADARNVNTQFQKFYYDSQVWQNTKWLGIPSDQAPTDNWSMQELITDLRPDYIVETGTLYGGTTLFYAAVLSSVNPQGKVITVDIAPEVQVASQMPLWKERVEMIVGSSTDPQVTSHIAQEVLHKKVLVTLDSLHTRDHVLKEMEIYSKLVDPGSYLVVQDTNLNGNPVRPDFGPGPMEAVQQFLSTNHDFVVDRAREKFLLTFYPGGWLKRVK